MMLRLNQSERRGRGPGAVTEEANRELFAPARPFRDIIVLIDVDVLAEWTPPADPAIVRVDPRVLLSRLLTDPHVALYRYADDGPPSTVEPTREAWGTTLYEGWAVVTDRHHDEHLWQVVLPTKEGFSLSAVVGNAIDVSAGDTHSDAYRELGGDLARERRRADTLAAMVAEQAVKADLYITDRPYLHDRGRAFTRGVTFCRPEDALPLLSLYLRRQGRFLVDQRFAFNRGLFFWVGTRELLPEAWRWFTACVQHSTGSGDDAIMLLGGSLLQRVDRALEARDEIHAALNRTQNNDVREDALAHLDVVLILLMAAMDVTARVAHRVLGLPPGDEYRAAWQSRRPGGWFDAVQANAPALAAVIADGTPGADTLTILRLLRNSVHGAALQGVAFSSRSGSQESLVGLPRDDEAKVLDAMDRLGGRDVWGIRRLLPGRSHVDPGLLVDRLLVSTVETLNPLMAATPVEALQHVALSRADRLPPDPEDALDPFAPWIRQSIRVQLGL